MSMMDQQKLCIGGNSIFWQKENKIPFVHDGSTEIISRSEAKYFMFIMDQHLLYVNDGSAKLYISGNSIFWQKQSKMPYV